MHNIAKCKLAVVRQYPNMSVTSSEQAFYSKGKHNMMSEIAMIQK